MQSLAKTFVRLEYPALSVARFGWGGPSLSARSSGLRKSTLAELNTLRLALPGFSTLGLPRLHPGQMQPAFPAVGADEAAPWWPSAWVDMSESWTGVSSIGRRRDAVLSVSL